jgi:hypothetical protein
MRVRRTNYFPGQRKVFRISGGASLERSNFVILNARLNDVVGQEVKDLYLSVKQILRCAQNDNKHHPSF